MKNIIKKSILLGVGAAAIAQEKSLRYIRQAAKKSKIREKDIKPYIDKVLKETKKQAEYISGMAEKEVDMLMKNSKGTGSKEIQKLKSQIISLAKEAEKRGKAEIKKMAK